METELKAQISELAETAGRLRDACNDEFDALQNITFEKNAHGASIVGNRSGLIELARQIIMVAAGEWHHAHIDEAAFASRSDGILTVALDDGL